MATTSGPTLPGIHHVTAIRGAPSWYAERRAQLGGRLPDVRFPAPVG